VPTCLVVLQQRGRRHAEGLAYPLEQRRQSGFAAQHGAGQGGQGFGFGGGVGGLPGPSGGPVDDRTHQDGH
jgi:hypothetical protein